MTTITVLLHVQAHPGGGPALIDFYQGILGDTRTRPGCLEVRVVRDLDDANRFTLIERWESKTQQEAYVAWRTSGNTMDGYSALLADTPTLSYYTDIDT